MYIDKSFSDDFVKILQGYGITKNSPEQVFFSAEFAMNEVFHLCDGRTKNLEAKHLKKVEKIHNSVSKLKKELSYLPASVCEALNFDVMTWMASFDENLSGEDGVRFYADRKMKGLDFNAVLQFVSEQTDVTGIRPKQTIYGHFVEAYCTWYARHRSHQIFNLTMCDASALKIELLKDRKDLEKLTELFFLYECGCLLPNGLPKLVKNSRDLKYESVEKSIKAYFDEHFEREVDFAIAVGFRNNS